ncbi:translational machinery protein [Massilia sp. TS11]|uniref:translational machinery protein n=1 Tax=Massilia sp. TS11 TaxID=2908003 RepID=UPI001EDA2BFB|nr:translational machinery protein [Massilia sp. TS11]MCG2584222.1 translational machinery protein [Massilia sp. TS11]
MSFNHLVVWLDHEEAHLIGFNRDESESSVIKSDAAHKHVRGKTVDSAAYFDDLAKALKTAVEVLVVGPGQEKLKLVKHLVKHHHDQADKIVGVETIDHPSDGQLLAYARKYFHRVDNMR